MQAKVPNSVTHWEWLAIRILGGWFVSVAYNLDFPLSVLTVNTEFHLHTVCELFWGNEIVLISCHTCHGNTKVWNWCGSETRVQAIKINLLWQSATRQRDPASGFNVSGKSLTDDCTLHRAVVSGLPTQTGSDGSSPSPHVPHRRGLFRGRLERLMLNV